MVKPKETKIDKIWKKGIQQLPGSILSHSYATSKFGLRSLHGLGMKLLSAYSEQLCFPVHNCATLQKAFGVIHVSVAFSSRYCTCKILIRRLELLHTKLASCEYFKRNFFGGLSMNIRGEEHINRIL